jgi:hypothetical protein
MGSHPALDIHYSDERLTVLDDGARFTRIEKIRQLASWPKAIASLRVCPGSTVRPAYRPIANGAKTAFGHRLELLAAGIDETPTLGPSLTPIEDWEAIPPTIGHRALMYEELLEPLRARGLRHLCAILEQRIEAYKSWAALGNPWPIH